MAESKEDFFEKLIKGDGVSMPKNCSKSFAENFPDGVNVEWFEKETRFEAVFYRNRQEHIAIFNKTGKLIEYRSALTDGFLPEFIKQQLEVRGEIMNKVLINKGNSLRFEVIVRNNQLERILLVISDQGQILEEKEL